MGRIKTRLALVLAAAALSTVVATTPASADDTCHPYPQAYCWAMDTYYRCVIGPIIYSWPHCIAPE